MPGLNMSRSLAAAGIPQRVPSSIPVASSGPEEEIFLFVNPKSGGNTGFIFLEVPQPFIVRNDNGKLVSFRIYSLLEGSSGDKPGFHELGKTLAGQSRDHKGHRVKVIVGGGDGTVMWVVSEAEKHKIDVANRLIIGIVPLGTGNDFSRAAGWGGDNPPKSMGDNNWAFLRDLVKSWAKGKTENHDVWRVKLEVDPDEGKIIKVDKKNEVVQDTKVIDSPLLNYMSMGQDSEAGFDFEKHRHGSQIGNLFQYAFSGAKAQGEALVRPKKVKATVRGLYNGTSDNGRPIFITNDEEREEKGAPSLQKDPAIILVLNITSYAGGKGAGLWKASQQLLGVDPPVDPQLLASPSHPGDQKLEVVTLNRASSILTGNIRGARRVFTGAPLHFAFHQGGSEFEDEDDDLVAFFNIDGEFYKVVNPVSLNITLGGRLSVLHKVDNEVGFTSRMINNVGDGALTGAQLVVGAVDDGTHLVTSQVHKGAGAVIGGAGAIIGGVQDGAQSMGGMVVGGASKMFDAEDDSEEEEDDDDDSDDEPPRPMFAWCQCTGDGSDED
jgi:diacylglycerol kinase (ATP)